MARKIKKQKSIFSILHDFFHIPLWLFGLLILAFILRIPSFFEPFSYGDEMIYLALGDAVRKGLTLYKDIHDNKPPLLYFTAAIAGNVFWFRSILAIWMIATTGLFWKLIDLLFPNKKLLQIITLTTFVILTTIPLLEGQVSNAELFMIGPIIWAFYLLLSKDISSSKILLSGFLFAVATLFKVPAAFDIGVVIFIWLIALKFEVKSFAEFFKNTILLSIGFITPILLTFLWYYLKGALPEYAIAAFLQNVGYLSSFRPGDVQEPFLVKNGPLLFRAAIAAIGMLALYMFKNKLSKQFLFASAWIITSYFAITLSERPYPHYIIQAVPAISILVGMLVAYKKIDQVLAIIPLFVTVYVPVHYNFWYYKSIPYYARFIEFASGKINKEQYFNRFEGDINRNYQIAEFINSSTKETDRVFVWGNSSAIYALSRRLPPIKYVADYHINDFSSKEEVAKNLTNDPPKLVIILPRSSDFPELYSYLNSSYLLISTIEGADIYLHTNVKLQ